MAYLSKEARYNEILNLATRITIEEGLSGITARKISSKGNIAVGQIHHHFKSMSQLKALALNHASQSLMAENESNHRYQTTLEHLLDIICPMEGEVVSVMRKLWSEAQFLAEHDEEIKQAYKISVDDWYQAILSLVLQGMKEKRFKVSDPDKVTWLLISLSCGFDSLFVIDEFRSLKTTFQHYVHQILNIDQSQES